MAPSAEPPAPDDLSLTTMMRIAGRSITSSSESVVAVSAMNGGGGATTRWLLLMVLLSCDHTPQAWGLQSFLAPWHPGVVNTRSAGVVIDYEIMIMQLEQPVGESSQQVTLALEVRSPLFGLGIGSGGSYFQKCMTPNRLVPPSANRTAFARLLTEKVCEDFEQGGET